MIYLTAKQKRHLAKNIRAWKNRAFPNRGGGKRLAAVLGISPQLLASWQSGSRTPSPIQLAALARIFDVSIQELCAIPYFRRKASASDLIVKLTRHHEKAISKSVNEQKEQNRLRDIIYLLENELGGYL